MLAQPFAQAAAVCQSLTIQELLSAGVRILDFRVGLHEGEVRICHTVICGTTLQAALREVAGFLRAKGTEVVGVLIKRDWEHRDFDTRENWEAVQACIAEALGDLVVRDLSGLALPISALCERGQRAAVLVEVPTGLELSAGLPMTSATVEKSWRPDTRTVEDMLSVLAEWRDSGRMLPEPGRLKFLEVALPGGPRASAPGALLAFRGFLQGCQLSIGTMLDFPDEETIRTIVAKNWTSPA